MTRYATNPYRSRAFYETGLLTRGQYGDEPYLNRGWVELDNRGEYYFTPDPSGDTWAAWDTTYGWIYPWPVDDVVRVDPTTGEVVDWHAGVIDDIEDEGEDDGDDIIILPDEELTD